MEHQIQTNDYKCTQCDYPLVSRLVQAYSKRWFGKVLCRTCQGVARGEKEMKRIHDDSHETINLDNGQVGCITCEIKKEVSN